MTAENRRIRSGWLRSGYRFNEAAADDRGKPHATPSPRRIPLLLQ